MRVLCYTDISDNTKGTLLAVNEEKETRNSGVVDKINDVIDESGILLYEDPMSILEVCRQIAFLGYSKYGDYEFYFEEIPYIE